MPDALRWHAAFFAGAAVGLTLLNVLRSPDRLWFWAPLLVWAALLALHAWSIVRAPAATGALVAARPAASERTELAATPAPAEASTPLEPAPADPPMAPHRLPAAAELAALRLSLDPWATAALVSASARPEELPDSVLALWQPTPAASAPTADATPASRPAVDLQALGWI